VLYILKIVKKKKKTLLNTNSNFNHGMKILSPGEHSSLLMEHSTNISLVFVASFIFKTHLQSLILHLLGAVIVIIATYKTPFYFREFSSQLSDFAKSREIRKKKEQMLYPLVGCKMDALLSVLSIFEENVVIFWDKMPCNPLRVNRRFGGRCRLNLQDRRISQARNQAWKHVASIAPIATCSSETSVEFQWITPPYIPEDKTLHYHRCEYLKSHIFEGTSYVE
jgi:hypothetical protein